MSEELPKELSDFAQSLRSLQPRCELPNRDRLMYEAGRRSKRNHVWPATSGVLAVALAFSLMHQPRPEQIMIAVAPAGPSGENGPGYFRTRNAVLSGNLNPAPNISVSDGSKDHPVSTPLNYRLRDEI